MTEKPLTFFEQLAAITASVEPVTVDELAARRELEHARRWTVCRRHNAGAGEPCEARGETVCAARLALWRADRPGHERRRRLRMLAETATRLERGGVPGRYLELARADSWDGRLTQQQAARWLEADRPRGLVLYGETGTGKTAAACWAAAQVRGPVAFVSSPRLTGRSLYAPDGTREVPAGRRFPVLTWDEIVACELVIIDDVGSAIVGSVDTWQAYMVEMLRALCDDGRRFIITANCNKEGLRRFIDAPQIWDRLSAWASWESSGAEEGKKLKAGLTVRQKET